MSLARRAILLACLTWPGVTFAGDADLFEGLVPGEPLHEAEMAAVFGRGVNLNFQLDDGSLVTMDGADLSQTSNQTTSVSANSGITSTVPVTGDFNTVNLIVNVSVNLNTVQIHDSPGANPIISQSLDFGGGVIQALGN